MSEGENLKDRSWVKQLAGRFVVFDGPDGCGKSTQFGMFAEYARSGGLEVCEVREPGSTYFGEKIRELLLTPSEQEEMDVYCEMLLFMASRAQLVAREIRPALAAGQLVLADRFISSTLAYQGTAGGVSPDDIIAVGKVALRDCWPDLIVIFDVDEQTATKRMSRDLDRMEQKGSEYHRTVRQGYLGQVAYDAQRYLLIDARVSVEDVFRQLLDSLRQRTARWAKGS